MTQSNEIAAGRRAFRLGAGVAVATAVLSAWTTVVRDDGNGIGFFLVILAAGVGGFAAWFQAAGMARAMLGVAAMQASFGLAFATAPSTASLPGGGFNILAANGALTALWLVSAAFFRAAAKRAAPAAAA